MAAAPPRQEERHAAAKAPLARSGSLAARLRRRWRVAGLAAALVGGSGAATGAEAHGMMTEPRTRNVVAAQVRAQGQRGAGDNIPRVGGLVTGCVGG